MWAFSYWSLFSLLVHQAASTSHYFITTPRLYTAGDDATLSVSFDNLQNDETVRVELKDLSGKTVSKASEIINPSDTGSTVSHIKFTVPANIKDKTKLSVTGSGDVSFSHEANVYIRKLHDQIFIQTDKPVYKPGGKVRFRVVMISKDLKPSNQIVSLIYVTNPSGSRMMQWTNVSLDMGMVSLEMPISRKPVLGVWKIVAIVEGVTKEQEITVDEYVLPKFEVTVQPPPYILKKDSKVPITICAKYTYGKPVVGEVDAKICVKSSYRWAAKDFKNSCVNFNKKIDGCVDMVYEHNMDILNRYFYYSNLMLHVNATVTETATGVKLNGSKVAGPFLTNEVELKFVAPKHYKPGFMYKVKLFVTTPDGRPALNKRVQLKVTSNFGKIRSESLIIKDGVHEFRIYPSSGSKYYSYNAEYMPNHQKSEKMKMSKRRPYYYNYNNNRKVYGSGRSTAWYSPSENFIQIGRMKDLTVGSTAKITVGISSDNVGRKYLKYVLVCRGEIVVSSQKKITHSRIHVHFPVTHEMLPSCRILVYYVQADGEFISDYKTINFEMSYQNKVSLRFSDIKRKPGEMTSLTLKAAAGSKFALSAVDRSVQLLGATSDLREGQILNMLEGQDIERAVQNEQRSKCPQQGGCSERRWGCYYYQRDQRVDGREAVKETGLIYFSNAKVDILPCPERSYPIFEDRVEMAVESAGGALPDIKTTHFNSRKEKKLPTPIKPKLPKKEEKKPKKSSTLTVRSNFPETWLWTEESINSSGEKTLDIKVPDTITTWFANGYALSSTAGIGVAVPASVQAFQPFFVSLSLPYSVIRGETVKIPATIFNYMDSCLMIKVSLDQSNGYEIISRLNEEILVCGSQAKTFKFTIKPKKIGRIGITVRAVTSASQTEVDGVTAADAMTKKLLVEPEGIKKEISKSSFFCPRDNGGIYTDTFTLATPSAIVPGSLFAQLFVVGDLMGPSMDNIDKLLAMPYGCGEQNMLKFAPNIYIMDYLKATDQQTEKIKEKAKEYMRSGYQRELTYKHKDGAYSAFGESDKEGSTWLTAFVLRSYSQAQRYIYIDDEEIKISSNWLLSLQLSSGCFKEVGMVHHKDMKGGVTSGITMTAFVVIALIESGLAPSDPRIQNALSCITKGLDDVSDTYTASILAYTLTLAGSEKRMIMLEKLENMADKGDGLIHWEKKVSIAEKEKRKRQADFYYYYQAPSADIEMTAYALMAFLGGDAKFSSPMELLRIVKWLVKQRNSYGGFSSTQDTCVALQGLAQYSALAFGESYSLNIVTSATGFSKTFQVSDDNKLLLQRVEIPTVPINISIEATGGGCALVQADVKYNEPEPKEDPSFSLRVGVTNTNTMSCRHTMKVCGSYRESGKSNMALIDVTMVSGFEPLLDEIEMTMQMTNNIFTFYEFEDGVLTFYFDDFEQTSKCVEFSIEQVAEVEDRKPASVKIYDYYDTDKSATVMYSVGKCPEMNVV